MSINVIKHPQIDFFFHQETKNKNTQNTYGSKYGHIQYKPVATKRKKGCNFDIAAHSGWILQREAEHNTFIYQAYEQQNTEYSIPNRIDSRYWTKLLRYTNRSHQKYTHTHTHMHTPIYEKNSSKCIWECWRALSMHNMRKLI